MKKQGFLFLLMLAALGCKRNPIDRLVDPTPEGDVAGSSGIYYVFDDELKTGGGLGLIPGGENQSIDLNNTESPFGRAQIRYVWNGGDVYSSTIGAQQHLFAGFSLLVSPDFSSLDAALGKNLNLTTTPPYSKLMFSIRGAIAENTTVRLEGPDDGTGGNTPVQQTVAVTSDWQTVTLSIPDSSHFANVKVFLTLSFQYSQAPRTTNPGHGGVVYLDNIRYEK